MWTHEKKWTKKISFIEFLSNGCWHQVLKNQPFGKKIWWWLDNFWKTQTTNFYATKCVRVSPVLTLFIPIYFHFWIFWNPCEMIFVQTLILYLINATTKAFNHILQHLHHSWNISISIFHHSVTWCFVVDCIKKNNLLVDHVDSCKYVTILPP